DLGTVQIPTTIVGGGPTTVVVGQGGNLPNVVAPLDLENISGAANTIVVDDSSDTTARDIALSTLGVSPIDFQGGPNQPYGSISGLTPVPIIYESSGTAGVTVRGGTAGGTLTVDDTQVQTGFVGNGGTTVSVPVPTALQAELNLKNTV